MKTLFRSAIIVGILYVLTPCACDEFAQAFASSCPTSSHDCCGGSPSPSVHQDMDQKASLVDAVQVLPPVLVVHTIVSLPSYTFANFVASAGWIDTGPAVPSFNKPLLI